MKFSESWLRSFVAPSCSADELSHLLTMAGLEVEEEETVAPPFTSVVVGHVLEVSKHPDADRLNICRVDIGAGDVKQIVCGAPNVAPGLKVPCALPGAELPGDFKIRVAKVRGIESSGMLCSAKELGIAEDASGLLVLQADAPVGENLRNYLDLDDRLLTLKLTPNRADCLSMTGVAREVAALTGAPVCYVEIASAPVTISALRKVVLDAPEACPRYCGRIITGVNARANSPEWMKRRLERSGIRPISALVDITNYVMLELGQPLHAFDNAKLKGTIHARMALSGEKLLLLNGQALELKENVLLIADEEGPVAMAGIMGGEGSGITLETSDLFLESAFFAPQAIAGRARHYGFVSDASHRFERGVDFSGTLHALERATQLVLDICGGQAGPVSEALATLPQRQVVRLRTTRVAKVLGFVFSPEYIGDLFSRLGISFTREGNDFLVTPPSYRFDIEIEEDLIEEVIRLHGYDNIPSTVPRAALSMLPQPEDTRTLSNIRQILTDCGFQEVINFAFVEENWETHFAGNVNPIRLANPIASQMSVMRSTLIAGLVANVSTNLKRKQSRIRVFETGRCFSRDTQGSPVAGFHQPWKLAALAYGNVFPEQWGVVARNVDFYDVKADLELLMAPTVVQFENAMHPALHPGRCALVRVNSQAIGFVGELHPEWVQKYELPLAPVVFEIELSALMHTRLPQYSEVSRQPPAIRDLSIIVEQKIKLKDIFDGMQINRPSIIRDIRLFDVYAGTGVEAGRKSLAFRIVMQDAQKTLQDTEVDAAMNELVSYLKKAFSAELRV